MWTILMLGVIFGVVALDQLSKLLVLHFLYNDQVTLIPGVLNFTYVENRGMAFGWLKDHRWVFMVFSVVGIALLCFYLFRYVKKPLGRVALSMIIGGGIGNMIDRVALGYVVDFIDFCLFDFWKWVFNIADTAVCVGAALFILELILEMRAEYKKSKDGSKKAEKAAEQAADAAPAEQAQNKEEEEEHGAES